MPHTFHTLFPTPFGRIGLLWVEEGKDPTICRVILSNEKRSAEEILKERFPDSVHSAHVVIEDLAVRMSDFLRGEDVTFEIGQVMLDHCRPFQQQVLRIEHGVPRGRVTSYQRIAARLGRPHSARGVGRALAGNPFPILIPCHRAIRSDGSLGGFQGGLEMKRALLKLEGVEFASNGKVFPPSFY
jgi:methylated-DNA-[protein]-cysteine S-methyltransferase